MKIFYSLSFILLISLQAQSQDRRTTSTQRQGPAARIIKFYPNPAVSVINFDFQRGYDRSYSFQIFNFLGKKVYEVNNVSEKNIINLTDFYRGVYIFQLRDKTEKVIGSGKFHVSK